MQRKQKQQPTVATKAGKKSAEPVTTDKKKQHEPATKKDGKKTDANVKALEIILQNMGQLDSNQTQHVLDAVLQRSLSVKSRQGRAEAYTALLKGAEKLELALGPVYAKKIRQESGNVEPDDDEEVDSEGASANEPNEEPSDEDDIPTKKTRKDDVGKFTLFEAVFGNNDRGECVIVNKRLIALLTSSNAARSAGIKNATVQAFEMCQQNDMPFNLGAILVEAATILQKRPHESFDLRAATIGEVGRKTWKNHLPEIQTFLMILHQLISGRGQNVTADMVISAVFATTRTAVKEDSEVVQEWLECFKAPGHSNKVMNQQSGKFHRKFIKKLAHQKPRWSKPRYQRWQTMPSRNNSVNNRNANNNNDNSTGNNLSRGGGRQ